MGFLQAIDDAVHRRNGETDGPVDGDGCVPVNAAAWGSRERVVDWFARALHPRSNAGARRSAWRLAAVAIAVYVLAVSLSYLFVLKPIWERRDALVAEKTMLQDYIVLTRSNVVVSNFREGLMQGDQRMTVISELEELARETGLEVVGDAGLLRSKEVSDHMTEYPIELSVRGDYHEVGEFIGLVNGSSRCLIVKEIDLSSRAPRSKGNDVTLLVGAVSWEK
jgi:Tfp pilus assembly protein PilO